MKVIAYTKYDREAASTRQRLLQYFPTLAEAGIEVEYRPLLSDDYVRSLASGVTPNKFEIARAYIHRWKQIRRAHVANVIWVYAELYPWLPAGFERLLQRHKIPVVYDFDDAFFLPYDESDRWLVRSLLRNKLRPLIENAAACTCGNEYLRDYAARWCPQSIIIPTVVDTERYLPVERERNSTVIGWIGSPTTWRNMRPLLPLLAQLHAETGVRIRAIGAGAAAESDRFPGLELVDWNEECEVSEVQRFNIGIMPLLDMPFERGKSGYKLIQYMACGIPTVASPVGVNTTIVADGQTGYLARTEAEWKTALERLLRFPELQTSLGAAGRARAVRDYSLAAWGPRLVELLREVASR